jgi:hypothetical protein
MTTTDSLEARMDREAAGEIEAAFNAKIYATRRRGEVVGSDARAREEHRAAIRAAL